MTEPTNRSNLIATALICLLFTFIASGCVATILDRYAAIKQAEADAQFSAEKAEAYHVIQTRQLLDAEDARRADELAAQQARADAEAQARREFYAYLVAQGTMDVNEAAHRAAGINVGISTDAILIIAFTALAAIAALAGAALYVTSRE
jgi:hypothetical protein